MDPEPVVPGYRVIRRVGGGAQGTVYEATQSDHQRVALKLVPVDWHTTSDSTAVLRERRALGALQNHPNVVTLLDVIPLPNELCMVTTWCEGGTLATGRNARTVVSYGIQLLGALCTAEGIGVFHGDIKPENVLLDEFGKPRLADFGVASIPGFPSSGFSPMYAPPERPALDADALADQYSLGRTLWACADQQELSAYPELKGVLERATDPDRTKRFPSHAAFLAALQGVESKNRWSRTEPTLRDMGNTGSSSSGSSTATRRWTRRSGRQTAPTSRRGAFMTTGAILTTGGLIAGWALVGHTDPPATTVATVDNSVRQPTPTALSGAADTSPERPTRSSASASTKGAPIEAVNGDGVAYVTTSGDASALRNSPMQVAGALPRISSIDSGPGPILVAAAKVDVSGRQLEQLIVIRPATDRYTVISDGTANDRTPAIDPSGTWVAFSSTRNGTEDIYRVKLDGSSLENLTGDSTNDRWPSWSSQGDKIIWVSSETGAESVKELDVGSRAVRTLLQAGRWESPKSNADGSLLAAVGVTGSTRSLQVLDRASGDVTAVADTTNVSRFIWRNATTISYLAPNGSAGISLVTVSLDADGRQRGGSSRIELPGDSVELFSGSTMLPVGTGPA